MKVLDFLSLIRIKDWLKNIIIFLPLIFSGYLINITNYTSLFLGFVIFSLVSSSIYILNDIIDLQNDSNHPEKKFSKPLASGKIALNHALIILFLCILLSILLIYFTPKIINFVIIYLIINITYNLGLKKIPYLEIFLVSGGYIVRIDVGSHLINVESSIFLIIAIYCLAIFFLILKRLAEMNHHSNKLYINSRTVLKYYKKSTLKYLSFIFMISLLMLLCIYILTINYQLFLSFILVAYFLISYYLSTINETYAENPISYVFSNKKLLITSILSLLFSLLIYI